MVIEAKVTTSNIPTVGSRVEVLGAFETPPAISA